MKHWLIHLWDWLRSFPIKDYHCDGRAMSEKEYTCMICGRKTPIDDGDYVEEVE